MLEVKHQDLAMKRLAQAAAGGRLSHSYIFSGPEGVGKKLAALKLAQYLLCAQPDRRVCDNTIGGCGQCDDCTAVDAGSHVDLNIIDRSLTKLHPDTQVRNRKAIDLLVDVIRHFVVDVLGHRPARGRARVFIIDEAERMTTSAQNALLKSLEEPTAQCHLILLTSSNDLLLPTTRSRCQIVPFMRLPDAFVNQMLIERATLEPEDAAYLVGLVNGQLGLALRYAEAGLQNFREPLLVLTADAIDDPLGFSRTSLGLAKKLAGEKIVESEEAGSDSAVTRQSQLLLMSMIACVLRDVMRVSGGRPPIAYINAEAPMRHFTKRLGLFGSATAIRAVAEAESHLDQAGNAALTFDSLGIAIGRATRVASVA